MRWIRMEVSLIYDETTRELDTNSRLTWMLLLLYSGQTRNKLPWSPRLLKSILGTARAPNLALFAELGLIEEFHASTVPAECAQNASLEDIRGEDIREQDTLKSASARAPSIEKLWNEHRDQLPAIERMTSKRESQWQARWRSKPDEQYWIEIIQRIARSPFCLGGSASGWKATVDFLLRPDSHIKISEGAYDAKEQVQVSSSLESNLKVFRSVLGGGGDVNAG